MELLNLERQPVDLSGASTRGITYTFPAGSLLPAGGRALLVTVDDAKRDIPPEGVQVWHYTEVNHPTISLLEKRPDECVPLGVWRPESSPELHLLLPSLIRVALRTWLLVSKRIGVSRDAARLVCALS